MKLSARQLMTSALFVALLIALQFALSPVAGVELVTVFFLCFCYAFGWKVGCLTATAFSLLRSFLFGFAPNVVALYLVYYNLFALLFGNLKGRKIGVWVCPILLGMLVMLVGYFALFGVPVSILYVGKLTALSWVLFGILCLLFLLYFILLFRGKGERGRMLANVVTLACVCTLFFTLLDDVLTPLFYRYSWEGALAYFYASFLTMIPQTLCCAVSVGILFLPLEKTFATVAKGA